MFLIFIKVIESAGDSPHVFFGSNQATKACDALRRRHARTPPAPMPIRASEEVVRPCCGLRLLQTSGRGGRKSEAAFI
jgi:hypothetical protein